MAEEIFSLMAEKIKKAGSKDPRRVADYYDFLWVDLQGSLQGYAALYNRSMPAIGLHVRLENSWYMFGGWHELSHIFLGDIYEPMFTNGHADTGFFNYEVNSLRIPKHERLANLVAADVTVQDEDVELVTGLNSPLIRSYREKKAHQKDLRNRLSNLKCQAPTAKRAAAIQALALELSRLEEALEALEEDIIGYGYNKTFAEIARELGISERILRYKLEAMRQKGADIDPQELEAYDQMFRGVL